MKSDKRRARRRRCRASVNCESTPYGLLNRISRGHAAPPRRHRACARRRPRHALALGAAGQVKLPAPIAAVVPQRHRRAAPAAARLAFRAVAHLARSRRSAGCARPLRPPSPLAGSRCASSHSAVPACLELAATSADPARGRARRAPRLISLAVCRGGSISAWSMAAIWPCSRAISFSASANRVARLERASSRARASARRSFFALRAAVLLRLVPPEHEVDVVLDAARRIRRAVPSSTSSSRSATISSMWRSWLTTTTAPTIFGERLDERLARIDVEVVGRLVEDQQVRRVVRHQRQRQPRALAARELARLGHRPCRPKSRSGRADCVSRPASRPSSSGPYDRPAYRRDRSSST